MFQLQKSFKFEASHQLSFHDGMCANVHGHSYCVTLQLSGPSLQTSGPCTNMLCDFKYISEAMKPLLQNYLDHRHLNDTLKSDSPTAEFVAHWIYKRLQGKLPLLDAVVVRETSSAVAIYRPRKPNGSCFCHSNQSLDKGHSKLGEQQVVEYSDSKSDDSEPLEAQVQ